VNGRTSTLSLYLSSVRREVVGPLRQALPWALVAAVLAAVVAGGAAAALAATHQNGYTAAASFDVIARPANVVQLSRNRGLTAEQVLRSLRSGRAHEIAASAAPAERFSSEWVPGPGFGQVSYQIRSTDPTVALAAARAVHDQAGFLGLKLVKEGAARPTLDLLDVAGPTPTEPANATTIGAGAALGAATAFVLALLFAVPIRRPEDG
jgi:hypothetical protein